MKVEMKEVLILTEEEKKAIHTIHMLMADIMEQITDPDIYTAAKHACMGLEEFAYVADM